jgi:pyruvate dehydrogenase E1 component beta subunit
MTMAKALNEGLRRAMLDNDRVLLMGEDIGTLGGVFRVTDGLLGEFGAARVVDTPLAESAIVGTAVGLAMRGYRAVCEIQFDGFVYPAFDQIVSQVAKLRKRSEGRHTMGLVIRIPYQGGIGGIEHHSESPESYFAHTAGLRVVTCANPNDAYWMMQQAVACDDPVIFFEPKSRYWDKGEVDLHQAPQGLFEAAVRRRGDDVTLVGYGAMVKMMLAAAEVAADEGRSLEVIDLRSLSPLDLDPLVASVSRTGRLVMVQESPAMASVGASVLAEVSQRCFYHLRAPGLFVSAYPVPYPISRYEEVFRPSVARILDGVDRAMEFDS